MRLFDLGWINALNRRPGLLNDTMNGDRLARVDGGAGSR